MEIPKQLPKGEIQAFVTGTQNQVASGSKIVLIGNFALNFLLSGSLNDIWSAINAQQLIILMPLCDVSLPANVLDFFGKIFEIAAFDIYPNLGENINWLLNLEPTEPMTKGFEELGFESVYILNNMGTMTIFFIGYPALILLQKVLQRCKGSSKRAARVNQFLKKSLYYSSLVNGIYEGFSVIAVGVLIGLYHIRFDSYGTSLQSGACILFAIVLTGVPCLIIWHAERHFTRLSDEGMLQFYGSLFSELRLESGRAVLLEPAFFMCRRFIVAFAIVVCRHILIVQVYLIWAQTTIAVYIIGFADPYTSKAKAVIEIFNELTIISVLYTIICLSDFVPEEETKVQVGNFACAIVSLHLVVSISRIMRTSILDARRSRRMKKALAKLQEERQINKERLIKCNR